LAIKSKQKTTGGEILVQTSKKEIAYRLKQQRNVTIIELSMQWPTNHLSVENVRARLVPLMKSSVPI